MKALSLGLFAVLVASTACSKSSAKPATEQHAAPASAAAPDVGEVTESDCDNACTALAQCFEIVNPGSNFRDGGRCAEHCEERPAADQKAFAKEAAEALRTNHCETLFPEGESVESEENEEDEVLEKVETFEKLDPALRPGKPLKLNGASFELKSKQTQPGGDNQAPTFDDRVTATCHNKAIELFHETAEGMTTTTTLKALDSTHVLVQFVVHVAREGESSREERALRFDTATCAVVK